MNALFLSLVLLAQPADSTGAAGDGLDYCLLFHSTASADLETGLKDLAAQNLTIYPGASYNGSFVKLSGEVAVNYSADSTETDFDPVRAGAYFRWPGSPWAGTGVSTGLINPFVPGLGNPVREWNSYGTFDSTAVTVDAGGFLGFQGFWHQIGDSLSWYGVKSPWLGFGSVNWNSVQENSSGLETVSGFLKLKRIEPWFLFVRENSHWTYTTEVRGWTPVYNSTLSVEVVPIVSLGEDSSSAGAAALLSGRNRAVSGFLKVNKGFDDTANPSVSAGLNVLSQAGVDWSASVESERLDTVHGLISGFYRSAPAGCGSSVELFDDSLRVTVTALYSPVLGVSTELSVMSDLDTDSPEPGCLLHVFGAGKYFTGGVTIEWEEGSTALGLEVSAWID